MRELIPSETLPPLRLKDSTAAVTISDLENTSMISDLENTRRDLAELLGALGLENDRDGNESVTINSAPYTQL